MFTLVVIKRVEFHFKSVYNININNEDISKIMSHGTRNIKTLEKNI
jgi:hypothetical protein